MKLLKMEKAFEQRYYENEYRNWWFVSRRQAILKLLKNYDKKIKILDIGCGAGSLIKELILNGFQNVYGIDCSASAIAVCNQNNLKKVYQMDGQNPSFDEETFDIIIASDVIEHFENDTIALKNFNKILKKGGALIIFVPAYNFFWSKFDEVNHHYRRYSRMQLVKRIQDSNFHIEKSGFWNFSMFFPAFLMFIIKFIFNMDSGSLKQNILVNNFGSFINQSLILLVNLENIIFQYFRLPIGMSIFALARKSE